MSKQQTRKAMDEAVDVSVEVISSIKLCDWHGAQAEQLNPGESVRVNASGDAHHPYRLAVVKAVVRVGTVVRVYIEQPEQLSQPAAFSPYLDTTAVNLRTLENEARCILNRVAAMQASTNLLRVGIARQVT